MNRAAWGRGRNFLLATPWILLILLALGATPASAAVIGFDDLLGDGEQTAPIEAGYSGLTWSNFFVLDTVSYTADAGANGYANGVTSARNVAYAGYGSAASFAAAQPFMLASYTIGAAWNNDMAVTVQGWRDGLLVASDTFQVSAGGSILRAPGWTDIDTVSFSASGGDAAGFRGWGTQYYLDDIHIDSTSIPEPGGIMLLATFAGFGLLLCRGAPVRSGSPARTRPARPRASSR